MATFTKFNAFVEHLAEGVHNLGSNQLVIALTNTAPTAATDDTLSDLTQITYTNLSSRNVTTSSSSQTSGTYSLGATYRAARRYGASSVIDKTLGDGVTVNDADAGIVDITFVPDDTQSLSGDFLHELELTEASGDVLTAFQGFLSLDQALIP